MEISVIGINHRSAPVDVRERISLAGGLAEDLLRIIRKEKIFQEALVLDTCNRTEFYSVADSDEAGGQKDALHHMLGHVAELKGTDPLEDLSLFYRYEGLGAVSHLFRVAAGLDSQVLGEDEILGQVRRSYSTAVRARTARFLLNRLLHRTLGVGKRVRTETELGAGSASVAQAAVELAAHVFTSLEGKSVLLVGAGQTAELAARALVRSGAGRLIVANRTLSRAQRLSRELLEAESQDTPEVQAACRPAGDPPVRRCPALQQMTAECPVQRAEDAGPTARAIELHCIPEVITDVELVISSTGAQDFVLDHEQLAPRLRRLGHSLLMVDIAVPRDIDPRLSELPEVYLYNIDDLDSLVQETLERRRREVPRAEAIVQWEVEQFSRWFDSLQVVPTIKQLQRRMQQLGDAEIERYGSNFENRKALERFTRGLCGKILHRPMAMLRDLSGNNMTSDDLAAVDLIRTVFDLDALEEE